MQIIAALRMLQISATHDRHVVSCAERGVHWYHAQCGAGVHGDKYTVLLASATAEPADDATGQVCRQGLKQPILG